MNWTVALASILVAFLGWTTVSIISNYIAARKVGLPLVISPVYPMNPFWIITYKIFPIILWLKNLPFGLGTWARCTYIGWQFHEKHDLHDELGPMFLIVTPGGNEVVVADAQVAHTVLSQRKEFIKPPIMYDQLNVFGPNLDTVEGEDWQRHRRLTAPSFNERTSSLVWDEAIRQTKEMAPSWTDQGRMGTSETVPDTATIALHVLTSVGFGLSYPFHGGVRDVPAGHAMTYKDALALCLGNIITFSIFSRKTLSRSWLPKKLRALGVAAKEFQTYMEEMLSNQRAGVEERENESPNLMSALVRASEEAQKTEDESGSRRVGLSDDEIFGNIFIYNLAGHESTANTIAASLVLLAAHPECQEWLAEEIHQVLGSAKATEGWKYEVVYPKLQRCLAVMYETLRLYGSIVFIPKSTSFHSQTLTLKDRTHVLPPDTFVIINVEGLHTDPKIWGPDALVWRPSRWLRPAQSEKTTSPRMTPESFIEPDPGAFIPWADGPRSCVGRKFSQVEFVAVIATLFSQYRVRPVLRPGESEADGQRELQSMVDNSAISAITLQMREPKKRALRWEKRTLNG